MEAVNTRKTLLGIIVSLLILILSNTAATVAASVLVVLKLPAFIGNIAAGILYIVFAVLLLRLLAKKMFKVDMKDLGIPKFSVKTKWIIIACMLPLTVTAVYMLIMEGELRGGRQSVSKILDVLSAGLIYSSLGAGVVEEMVFRGFIMHLIMKKWGKLPAVIIPSVLFGTVHILGMGYDALSCVQVIIAGTAVGIMFSLIALEEDSIWNSAAVHVLWNAVMIGGIVSVSESYNTYSVFTYVLKTKNFMYTGGAFGVESSVISIIMYIAVAIIALPDKKDVKKPEAVLSSDEDITAAEETDDVKEG